MDHLLIALLVVGSGLLSLAAAGHALLFKRDSRSALVWTSLTLTLPILGPFLYWCLGINRISRRARSWQESGRRVSGTDIVPITESHRSCVLLPAAAAHLHDLCVLGDRIVATPLRSGNLIELLENGDNAYPAMLAAIMRAKESINLSSYIFDADEIGADFVDQLIEATGRGVAVRIIIDALGDKYSKVSPVKIFRGSAVRLEHYLPLRHGAYINLRNHRKLLIIDGHEAFTGGMNIRGTDSYTSKTSNVSVAATLASETATSITLRGPLAQETALLRSDLKKLEALPNSLMPAGLEQAASKQDLADLLAYLKGEPGR